MALETQPKVCLGVAVDHRIRRLFKPVLNDLTERSEHTSRIEARGRSLKRSREEIQVTTQLAGPAVKGGIAIALQQPRHNHPFEKGLDAVIENCETLNALCDIFTKVSCETLDIRTDITVVDLLPYVSEDVAKIGNAKLRESFRASVQVICDKEPDVLLCAGRVWLPKVGKFDNRKGDAWKFESVGLGKTFGSTRKLPVTARVRHGERGFVSIRRVNGFHPSHAMNYHAHASVLRQLQILIGAETCGMLRGDWEDKEWMDGLRRSCQNLSRPLPASPPKYLPYYKELYSEALLDLQNYANPLISDPRLAKRSPGALYETLLSSSLSGICNDTTLILHQMSRLQHRGWPDSVTRKNEAILKEAATDTLQFTENLLRAVKQGNDTRLAKIIRRGAKSILQRVTVRSGKLSEYELDLSGAGDAFLELAMNIETLLSDLLLGKEEALSALGQEEVLSSMMGKMNLAPQL
ncbi:hypothetical protein K458DRAFT_446679 [Lentithecium fluviatile CBS 122367]|uniref:Uncharacterized protein n=1 Tax=Lentithecium fluviatile CBS 122367 TaxID=1168545 RepID=A0A6G1II79_9PLEO|nr:hypothetical protein K458DRAFT_446679 [Lentithecium fluviatile CBS 122367]